MTLFARAFLLVALLIVLAVLASFQIYRVYEREPRSRELAQQTVSVVNLTRAALVNADPFRRRELLVEMNEREGLRVYPVTQSERLEALPPEPLFSLVADRVRAQLGERTRFAFARDAEEGFWVSFFIDVDEFWVMLPRERFEPQFDEVWLLWGAGLLALALAGAWLIASAIARPLAALAQAAGRIGRGDPHQPLLERGPRELATVAAAFNRMARDLESMERERAMVLAGISHDLRTPLSRLRLSLEMSGAEREAASAIGVDVEEMDAIIGQFLDFARGETEAPAPCDLEALVDETIEHYRRLGRPVARSGKPASGAPVKVARQAIRRALANLVDNALRHAGTPAEIATHREAGSFVLEVLDRGPGIPPEEIEHLKRPFARRDDARAGPAGAGLGLAIVERVARAHGARFTLSPRDGGGLSARLTLPA
jgi:two-component system osmolarity sensor histidine kinase EnvZ